MKLYTHGFSPNGRRAWMAALLTDSPIEVEIVQLAKGEHMRPDYLALNPNHKVPTLVDGGVTMWESNAIAVYLAAKAGRADLWPTEPAAQADVMRWILWSHNHWNLPIGAVAWERVIKPMMGAGAPDTARIEASLKEFAVSAKVLDAQLAGRDYVCGAQLTLADLALGTSLMYADRSELPYGDYSNVSAWFGRVRANPAWAATEPSL